MGDNLDQKVIKKSHDIIRRLMFDKKALKLILSLRRIAFLRTEDNAVMSQSTYYVRPLYEEIARRLGLDYQYLKELLPQEIACYLKNNQKVPQLLIRSRRKLTGFITFQGKLNVLTGNKAGQLKNIIDHQLKKSKQSVNFFTGVMASGGKVCGRVKLCLSSKDSYNLKKGEILVAPATSADFVTAMRKAAAIVTEFGGITSHAAVVSREFGLPCLVGVKDIIKFVKSGDLVEVDADRGVVRKIK